MFMDSHCHIEDDEIAFRAGAAGVGVILNAGKDLDEAAAQLLMCERMGRLRAEQRAAGGVGLNGVAGELNGTGAGGEEGTGAGDGGGGSGENGGSGETGEDGRGSEVRGGAARRIIPQMWTSAGVHPDSAPEKLGRIGVAEIVRAAEHPKVIAIGECGLDYHYGADAKAEQKEMFARHIEAAGITGLPLMIHQREAEDDMLDMLRRGAEKFGGLAGVIHCFTSTQAFADAVRELGFYISASGIVTFKSGADVAAVFASYPADKILIETDSPYLAPVPYRGKTNEPAFVVKTAEKIAAIKGLTIEETARITTDNFFKLYRKAKR